MQEEIDHNKNEISIKQLFTILLNSKKKIAFITFLLAGIGVLYALMLPVQFSSEAKVLPEIVQSGGSKLFSGFSSIAGLAGLDVDNLGNSDAVRPNLYPDIVQSTPFVIHLLNMPVKTKTGEKYESLGHFLSKGGKKTTLGKLVKDFFDLFKSSKENNDSYATFKEIQPNQTYTFSKQQENIIKSFQSRVISSIDKKTGIISISVKMPDPNVAGFVANESLEYLKKYVVDYRLEKLKIYEKFLTDKTEEAKKRYESARYNLSNFRDRNKNLFLFVPKNQEEELKYEYDLAFGLYLEVSKKLEQTKIQAQNETPVLKVLEPAKIPLLKSEPKRTVIVISFAIVGFIFALIYSLFKGINWSAIEF
ncbi:MAG: Wzz/FepE/Etk N-terminal domain-containing protein [Bacteroidota bacterium]